MDACSEATGPWPNVNPNGGADRCLQTPDGSAPAFSFCPEYGGAPTGFRLSAWSDAAPPRDGDQVEFDLTAKNPDWPLIHLARTITYTHTSVPDGENCDEQCTNAVLDADYP